jgi:chromosome segregation ATPase
MRNQGRPLTWVTQSPRRAAIGLRGDVEQLRTQLLQKDELLPQRNSKIERLVTQLLQQDELLAKRDGEVEQLRGQVLEQDELLTKRDGELERLLLEVTARSTALASTEAELVTSRTQARELERALEAQSAATARQVTDPECRS